MYPVTSEHLKLVRSTYPKAWLATPGLPIQYRQGPPPKKQRREAEYEPRRPVNSNQCQVDRSLNDSSYSPTFPGRSSHPLREAPSFKPNDSLDRHDDRTPMHPAKGHFYELYRRNEGSSSTSNSYTPIQQQQNIYGVSSSRQVKQFNEKYEAAFIHPMNSNRDPTPNTQAHVVDEDVEMTDLSDVPRDWDHAAEILDRIFRESRQG